MFRPLKQDLFEAVETIQEWQRMMRHFDKDRGDHLIFDHVREISHLSRTLAKVCALQRESGKSITGGNEIVLRWWSDLEPLVD